MAASGTSVEQSASPHALNVWTSSGCKCKPLPRANTTSTFLKSPGCGWNCCSACAATTPLPPDVFFAVKPQGMQVAVGVTTDPETPSARFNDNAVGFYLDAITIHHGREELAWKASNGYNSSIKDDLVDLGPWSKVFTVNITTMAIACDGSDVTIVFPGGKGARFPLPDHMIDRPLYALVMCWNGCAATVLDSRDRTAFCPKPQDVMDAIPIVDKRGGNSAGSKREVLVKPAR